MIIAKSILQCLLQNFQVLQKVLQKVFQNFKSMAKCIAKFQSIAKCIVIICAAELFLSCAILY